MIGHFMRFDARPFFAVPAKHHRQGAIHMRIRHKPYAKSELAAWPNFTAQPDAQKAHWAQRYANPGKPLHVELGCGKGGFLNALALRAPENNYLGVDIKNEMLVVAKRTTESVFAAG